MDASGRPVASGVYTIRVSGTFRDGKQLFIVNTTTKEGMFRVVPQ